MSYLNIRGLHKSYGATPIFTDINIEIGQGQFNTLLGPSGCGKSTLLRCIAGLTAVDGGQILLGGEDLVPVAPQKRGIGMVFQSYALFPNMTVQQNVAFGLRMQKVPAAEASKRVAEVLELVELSDYADRYPQQLSGGQCQRVALARSLVIRPRLLLLDEPLSALDARIRKHLREQIRAIQRELGLTVLQGEVDVAGGRAGEVGDFPLDPDTGEHVLQQQAGAVVELADTEHLAVEVQAGKRVIDHGAA